MRLGAAVGHRGDRRPAHAARARPPTRTSRATRRTASGAPYARVAAKRLVREHGLPMKIVGVDAPCRQPRSRSTSPRRAPGRLPRPRPRPRPHAGLPGRAAAAVGPRRGAGAGRHRPVRPGPVLRDVPQGLRAGQHPDGQGPGPADQPAEDQPVPAGKLMCCLKYEHPLYQDVQGRRPPLGSTGRHAGGCGPGGRPRRPAGTRAGAASATRRRCACSRRVVCAPRRRTTSTARPPLRTSDHGQPAPDGGA